MLAPHALLALQLAHGSPAPTPARGLKKYCRSALSRCQLFSTSGSGMNCPAVASARMRGPPYWNVLSESL